MRGLKWLAVLVLTTLLVICAAALLSITAAPAATALSVGSAIQGPARFLTGSALPVTGLCDDAAEVGAVYLRIGNPATVPNIVYTCQQTGASTYGWRASTYVIGTTVPTDCATGDVFFDTDAAAGSNWFGCTSGGNPGTWTALGGGGATINGLYVTDSGGLLYAPVFGPMTKFVLGDFTTVNLNTATIATAADGSITFTNVAAAGDNLTLEVKTAPATPYTFTAAFLFPLLLEGTHAAGLAWYDSVATTATTMGPQTSNTSRTLSIQKWTTPTAVGALYAGSPTKFEGYNLYILCGSDDGTNRKLFSSIDNQTWLQVFTIGRTDFMTPDRIGFFLRSNNAINGTAARFLGWKQGTTTCGL